MNRKVAISHYTREDIEAIKEALLTEKVFQIGYNVLSRMPKPICLVVGADTSGMKSPEENQRENRNRLCAVVLLLKEQGVSAPNCYPLLNRVNQIAREELGEKLTKQQKLILQISPWERLFRPILSSGIVGQVRFMPKWESSINCWQIWRFACEHGIEIRFVSDVHIMMARNLAQKMLAATKK
jgi:hypothetical protein